MNLKSEKFMEQKSEGHKKLERVNRRLEQNISDLKAKHEHLASFLEASGSFASLDTEDQTRILDILLDREGSDNVGRLKNKLADVEAKLTKANGYLDNRKAQVEDLKSFERQVSRQDKAAKRAIMDASTRMWGGYSEAGSVELQDLANCPYISPDLRALACYELARFYADNGRAYSAVNKMSDARALSKSYMRGHPAAGARIRASARDR